MVLLLALVIVGKAQTPLLNENFNNGFPSTWTSVDADGDGHEWDVINMAGHSGASDDVCITSQSYIGGTGGGALTPDNWLITPAIQIPSAGLYELTFWVCAQDASYPNEHYGLYITTNSDYENPANYTLIFEETIDANGGSRAQGAWKMKSYTLQNYAGQTIHVAFRHFNCTDEFYLNLDDVTIDLASTEPNVTVNTTSINFGSGNLGSNFGRKTFGITAVNLDQNITITLPSGTPFGISTDTVNFSNSVTLTPNASGSASSIIYVNFNPTTVSYFQSTITVTSQVGTHTITVEGLTIDCSQNQTIPWYETFTTTDFPSNCWTMTSTDTADYVGEDEYGNPVVYPGVKRYTWFNSVNSQYASVVGDTARVQDEHLYTPTFDLSNASGSADFQFDFRTNPKIEALINGNVRFTVRMSTDGGNSYTTVWDVADIRAEYAADWASWDDIWPVSFNMDQYLGTNSLIKFDFHYETDASAADQVIIQSVKFTNYHDPRMTVNADDTITFFTYVGNPETIVIPVNARNLSSSIQVSTTAPFEVSADGTTFNTTATLTTNGGNLYARYNPTANSSDNATISFSTNYHHATGAFPDTNIVINVNVIGNSYNCSVINLPITESFESLEGTVLAPNATEYCWSAIKANTEDSQNDIVNSNDYAYTGTQSFRFSSSKYNAQHMYDQYLITPILNASNPMLVMFNYANASVLKDETFRVGYSTTGNDINDFTWEADIVNTANTDWQLYRNTNVPANVKYVAIHYKSQYKAFLYIDNFRIMEAPSCLFPVSLHATSTSTNQADITWTAGGSETSWEMVYGEAPLVVETATATTVNTLGTTINGLTANTHYQVALRAICGSSYSSWSEPLDFWTTTTPATVPYTQTFEDNDADRGNWVLVNGDEPNYFTYGNIPGSTTGKALMITHDGTTNTYLTQIGEDLTSQYSTVWAYRDIQFPTTSAAGYLLTLSWKCFGEVDYDFGELFIGNATEVTNFERNEEIPGFVDVNATHYTPAGLTKLDRYENKSTVQTAAYLIPADGYAGKVKRLYFLWTNDSLSGAETPLAVDNINITIPSFANMTGTVTNDVTHAPIAGATITVVSNQGLSASATSDANGNYTINDLVAGYYSITVTANGYQTLNTGYALSEGTNNVPLELTIEECAIIPTNVNIAIEEDNLIFTWTGIEGGVLTQAASLEYNNAVGAGANYQFGAYHMFTPSDLNSYNGGTITSIGGYLNGALEYCTYKIRIWLGGSASTGPASPSPVYEQTLTPDEITIGEWTDFNLTTPFVIDGSQALWIGFHIVCSNAPESIFSMATGSGTNDGYANAMFFNNSWTTLLGAGLDGNWLIRANVVAPELSYTILEDGIPVANNIQESEYILSPFDYNACYQVTTTCENGEVSSPSDCVYPSGIGINNVNDAASFEVYPNPAHESVTVSTSMNAQKVEVLNYLGQVIYSSSVSSNNFTLNVANYADGVYFIRLSGDEGIATQKLIKK